MFGSQSSSSSQESQGSQGFSASLSDTLRYIGETIAQYTGLGSQSPPASQPHQPESLAETDDEIVLLPTPESNVHSRRLRTGAVSVQPGTGLKVRDYAYKNPLPPLKICKCCEPQALIERMARAPTPTLPYVVASPSSPSRNGRATITTPVASTTRAPLRPLKRSRPHRGGRIAGLNDLAFMPPEYFKPSQPKTTPSQDSSNNEERPAKRQRTHQREDAEPSLFGQSKRPSQSPKSAPRTPPRNKPIWLGAGPRNLFSPTTTTPTSTPTATPTATPVAGPSTPGRAALLAQFDADATPTPPYLPTELPKEDDDSFLGPTEETQLDEPMEDVVLTLTASITPQASEVFSDWSGFSRVSSISSLASATSRPSTPVAKPLGSKLTWNERAPSEESLDSFDSTMSGKTLVPDEHPQPQAGPSSPSSHYQLRPRPPNSASHGTSPLATPRSPSRKNTTTTNATNSAPRKTSTTTPRFARRRDVSPTLSLTLTKHTLPTSASSSNRSSSPRSYHKSLMTKTRSTMSREKTMSAIKPAVRRSPRTKNHAAVVAAAARNLKLSCVGGPRGARGQRRVARRVGIRRVRC